LSLCNGIRIFKIGLLGIHLFVEVPRRGDIKGLFRFSSQAAACYYQSNHSGRGNLVISALPKDTTSEHKLPAYLHTLSLFYAEHQSGKLWIPTFKVFWSDSARESKPGLPTFNTKIIKFYCSKDFKRIFFSWKHELLVKKVVIHLYLGNIDR